MLVYAGGSGACLTGSESPLLILVQKAALGLHTQHCCEAEDSNLQTAHLCFAKLKQDNMTSFLRDSKILYLLARPSDRKFQEHDARAFYEACLLSSLGASPG
jgi:hypothetical protein